MSKVYVVEQQFSMKGIFSTKKKAKKFIDLRLEQDPLDITGFTISRMTIDQPNKKKRINYDPPAEYAETELDHAKPAEHGDDEDDRASPLGKDRRNLS